MNPTEEQPARMNTFDDSILHDDDLTIEREVTDHLANHIPDTAHSSGSVIVERMLPRIRLYNLLANHFGFHPFNLEMASEKVPGVTRNDLDALSAQIPVRVLLDDDSIVEIEIRTRALLQRQGGTNYRCFRPERFKG